MSESAPHSVSAAMCSPRGYRSHDCRRVESAMSETRNVSQSLQATTSKPRARTFSFPSFGTLKDPGMIDPCTHGCRNTPLYTERHCVPTYLTLRQREQNGGDDTVGVNKYIKTNRQHKMNTNNHLPCDDISCYTTFSRDRCQSR